MVTGALAARAIVERHGLRPFLLVHTGPMRDFAGLATRDPNVVVVGDAAEGFACAAMNEAFHLGVGHPEAPLLALARNRCFRAADGLLPDAGPYVAAPEYATGRQAEVTGKPAEALFRTALQALQAALASG